jgi:hypothetical protein
MQEDENLDLPEDGEDGEEGTEAVEAFAEKKVTRRRACRKTDMGEVDEQGYYIDPDPSFAKELSETEKAKLTQKAALQVQAQLKKKASEDYLNAEIARLQAIAGVGARQLGGIQDELVPVVINLEWEGSAFIQLDIPHGRRFYHGMKYSVPRHIANEIAYIMQAQNWLNAQFNGKRIFEHRQRQTVLNMSIGAVSYDQVH